MLTVTPHRPNIAVADGTRPGIRAGVRWVVCVMGCLLAIACGDNSEAIVDAAVPGDSVVSADADIGRDSVAPLSWVDFAVSGCASAAEPTPSGDSDGGLAAMPCTGVAPLSLSFAAVAPSLPSQYLWSFGDGAESATPSPTHRFDQPGSYDITLVVGGAGGTASQSKPGYVVVLPIEAGGACSSSGQCADQDCACASPCQDATSSGVCTADCGAEPCTGGSCFDLRPTGPASVALWQRQLCLSPCATDFDCGDSLVCAQVKTATGAIAGACLFPGLAPIGAPCADATGSLDSARCASGTCVARGAHGQCAPACTPGGCPTGTACATFGTGDSQCVASCASADACTLDPLLACEAPGGSGPEGFTVDEPAFALGYCAPRACTEAADCPGGSCTAGHCVRL